jgi:hypothetical protein
MRRAAFAGLLAGLVLAWCPPALPCSLCPGGLNSKSLRQDADSAHIIVYGKLVNAQINKDDPLRLSGTTDLVIEKVLKDHSFLKGKTSLKIPRFVPAERNHLVFGIVFKDKDQTDRLDPFRSVEIKNVAMVEYVQGLLAHDAKDRSRTLLYCFNYLDHVDPEIANDAFLEFARSTDQEVGQVASKLDAGKVRRWLQDVTTPANRLSLYGFLLGACGTDKDAALLRSLLDKPTERTGPALDGILGGYIQLRPREGWEQAFAILQDDKRPFTERFAIIRMLRFYHGWKPEAHAREIARAMAICVEKGDLADLVIEDLRRWKQWDLTELVLAQFPKKSHEAPLVRRCIVRYALCCPRPEAKKFLTEARKADAEMVRDVEESLQFEEK